MTIEVQDDLGFQTRLVTFFDEQVKAIEFKEGLSQGLTTSAGPYKGKVFGVSEDIDKIDLDDGGLISDFKPP